MEKMSRRDRERLMKEDEIISAAEKIFIRVGFENASMDEIATEAEFTRKTVYQHFANKEVLYIAVVVRGFKRLLSGIRLEEQDGNNGFEKLRHMGRAYYKFYSQYPDTFRLMNLVGRVKSKEQDVENYLEFSHVNSSISAEISRVINEGKADGSIRSDLNTGMATYAAQFLMTGFFSQLSLSGSTFTEHFSIDQNDFIDFILDLIFDTFRNKAEHAT